MNTTWRTPAVLAASLLALLCWDFSGADAWVMAQLGGPQGFAWREDAMARQAYSAGRVLVAVGAVWLGFQLLRPGGWPTGERPAWPSRAFWLGLALVAWLLVLGLKRISLTSCPWELAEFGGVAEAVSHWRWGVADGGPGRCFPSGHASGGFALLAGWVAWSRTHPGRARAWLVAAWLVAALLLGTLMGATQVLRGAHFPSHVFWAGWLCAAWCVSARYLHALIWAPQPRLSQAPASSSPRLSRPW
jgi:membrane-associated PAP2 superfamily phosphatase